MRTKYPAKEGSTLYTLQSRKEVSCISTQNYYKLKWIALLTMLADHIAVCLERSREWTVLEYYGLRTIGRLAFPIFCFQLAESFYFTRNRGKHLLKILGLAVISEIPYDFMHGNSLGLAEQNVCFTLALGFCCIWISHLITTKINLVLNHGIHMNRFVKFLLQTANIAVFAFLAHILKVDYGYVGLLMIALMNLARKFDMKSLFIFAFTIVFVLKKALPFLAIFLDIPIIYHFSKKNSDTENTVDSILRSKPVRIISSLFYPLHMILLILCRAVFF